MALVWKSVGLWRVGCTAGAGSLPSGDGDTAAVLGGGGRCVLCVLLSTGLRGSPALCVHMSVRRASPVTWAGTVSGPHPCVKGSVRRRVNTIKTTDRGELLQKIRRMSNCFSTIKLLKKKTKKKPRKTKKTEQNPSGFVAGEATLAVAARRCGRRDFQVLAENGLEGLVSMHHGTEHQRLAGWRRRGDPARPGWREDKTPRHTGLAWRQARSERSPTGSGA